MSSRGFAGTRKGERVRNEPDFTNAQHVARMSRDLAPGAGSRWNHAGSAERESARIPLDQHKRRRSKDPARRFDSRRPHRIHSQSATWGPREFTSFHRRQARADAAAGAFGSAAAAALATRRRSRRSLVEAPAHQGANASLSSRRNDPSKNSRGEQPNSVWKARWHWE